MTDSTYDEAAKLWPFLAKYKKLIVAAVGSTAPLVLFLTSEPRTTAEILATVEAWVLLNLGVYGVKNA